LYLSRSRFDSYEAYVRKRWDEGCHNIQQIWREVKAQGYPHSDRTLRRHLEAMCGKKPAELDEAGVLDHFSAKKAVWRFANGLERDKAAVLAGLTLIHSNGQTEGQVTRIKLIKRMMFGRAGFALLRQRVLHTL